MVSSGRPQPQPKAQTPARTPADIAFDDPRSKYAVLAITYVENQTNKRLAWEAYDQLAAAGFPVVSPLLKASESKIFVMVGAAEHKDQLTDLLNRVKEARVGPRRRREFQSAYEVAIDHFR